jgi:hypothetical protein
VVDVHVGLGQEIADDLDVPALRRRDERHPAVAVGDRRIGAGVVCQGEDVEQALGACVQERVGPLGILGVDIGLGVDQRSHRIRRPSDGGKHERGRARHVAGVGVRAVGQRRPDGDRVAGRRRR